MEDDLPIGISSSIETRTEAEDHTSNKFGNIDDTLEQSIWQELNGRVDREYISRAILDANARYQNSAIKTFVPIFVRRYVLKRLQK